MGKEIKKLFLITIFLLSHLFGHPVIFKGGKVFWVTQKPNYNDIHFGISKTSNWLIGGRLLEDRNSNESFVLINNNYLLKRWNAPNSQANIYLLSSVGINTKDNKEMDESMVVELVDAIEHKLRKFQGLRITKTYPESEIDSELESEYEERTEPNYPDDQYDDAQVLSSAGWGTDEDYGGEML